MIPLPVLVHIAEDRTGWKCAQAAKDGRVRVSQIVVSNTDRYIEVALASASNSATYAAQGRENGRSFSRCQNSDLQQCEDRGPQGCSNDDAVSTPELEIVRDALNATQSHDDRMLFVDVPRHTTIYAAIKNWLTY